MLEKKGKSLAHFFVEALKGFFSFSGDRFGHPWSTDLRLISCSVGEWDKRTGVLPVDVSKA